MLNQVLEPSLTEFRNFNVCPHCQWIGEEGLLSRISEGIPMISRSDGRSFHLLLADRPLPYPAELSDDPAQKTSVCFWYVYGEQKSPTKSAVVVFHSCPGPKERMYRQIEFIADVLADELMRLGELAVFYNLEGNSVLALGY